MRRGSNATGSLNAQSMGCLGETIPMDSGTLCTGDIRLGFCNFCALCADFSIAIVSVVNDSESSNVG